MVVGEQLPVVVGSQRLQQARGALDIREEDRDRACRPVGHGSLVGHSSESYRLVRSIDQTATLEDGYSSHACADHKRRA